MNWTDALTNEINSYLTLNLKFHSDIDKFEFLIDKVLNIANSLYDEETSSYYKELNNINSEMLALQKEKATLVECVNSFEQKIEVNKKQLDEQMSDLMIVIDNKISCERTLKTNKILFWKNCSKEKQIILECNQKIELAQREISILNDTIEQLNLNSEFEESKSRLNDIEKRLKEISQKQIKLNKKIEKIDKKYKEKDVFAYVNDDDIKILYEQLSLISNIGFCKSRLCRCDFENLVHALVLATGLAEVGAYACKLPEKYSIPCRNLYNEICTNDFFDEGIGLYGLYEKVDIKGIRFKYDVDEKKFKCYRDCDNQHIYFVKPAFLQEILEIIKDKDINLPRLALIIHKKYCASSSNNLELLERFKNLYEETPEQILITEQRYYAEQKLKQDAENARLMRQAYERQAEYDREQEEENARLERVAYERQNAEYARQAAEESRRNRWQAEELYREAKKNELRHQREEERRRNRERREQDIADYKARQKAMLRCHRCANYNACGSSRGIPNCGAFKAKN